MARPAHFSPFPLSLSLSLSLPPSRSNPSSLSSLHSSVHLSLSLSLLHAQTPLRRGEAKGSPMAASSGDDAPRPNPLPSALVSNLQSVLAARRPPPPAAEEAGAEAPAPEAAESSGAAPVADEGPAKPAVLLTCAGGIRAPGLAALVDSLVAGGRCDVHVCAPESDKPACGYSITIRETITATSVDFKGAKAFEISGECSTSFPRSIWVALLLVYSESWCFYLIAIIVIVGTPVDCVSLALSGRLFSWSAPALVSIVFAICV
jgi:5'-nucleotidase